MCMYISMYVFICMWSTSMFCVQMYACMHVCMYVCVYQIADSVVAFGLMMMYDGMNNKQ
jgi:hypothetical protein